MPTSTCATCGRALSEHERHVRYILPDPVLDLPQKAMTEGTWMSGPDANESVMMQLPGAGPFVRALLRVRITGGYSVTFGVWVAIHPDDLQRTFNVWWSSDYADLRLEGLLGNNVPPWDLFAAPVELQVLDPDHTPYCVSSSNPLLNEVLTKEWEHSSVLDALPRS